MSWTTQQDIEKACSEVRDTRASQNRKQTYACYDNQIVVSSQLCALNPSRKEPRTHESGRQDSKCNAQPNHLGLRIIVAAHFGGLESCVKVTPDWSILKKDKIKI